MSYIIRNTRCGKESYNRFVVFLFRSEQDKLVVFVKRISEERSSQERLETATVAKAWSVNNYRLGNLKHHLQSCIVRVGKECVKVQYVASGT